MLGMRRSGGLGPRTSAIFGGQFFQKAVAMQRQSASVDLLGQGNTTGISAPDRFRTIKALINPETKPEELGRPGHIFPLKAKAKGVLRRAGHTEAVVDLTRMAGLRPGGALVEIMNDDGSMARLNDLIGISEKFGIKIIAIKDLIKYTLERDSIIEKGYTLY